VPSVFTGLNHICIVTADLDRAIRTWSDRYGVGPWSVYGYDRTNMTATVGGEPAGFTMRVALCQLGPNVRLELIQPVDGDSPYSQSLAERHGTDHIHHVRLDLNDYAESRAHLDGLGLSVELDATFRGDNPDGPRLTATYFNATDELGFIVEIVDRPDGFTMPPPQSVYP
jgi:methylmalonyl-CoA/ethylmalonyl-CoA epimerase